MPRDTVTPYRGEAVVAFLDILGYGAFIESNWGPDGADAVIKLVRGINEFGGSSVTNVIREGKQAAHGLHVAVISDSIVVCSPTSGVAEEVPWLPLSARMVMSHTAYIWAHLLANGLTLRGGIELGEVYWDDVVTTGPALIQAYRLESGRARSSRVVLGPGLVGSYAARVLDHWAYTEFGMRHSVLESTAEDDDGLLTLDPKVMGATGRETPDQLQAIHPEATIRRVGNLMRRHPRFHAKYVPLHRQLTRKGAGVTAERFAAVAAGYGERFQQ